MRTIAVIKSALESLVCQPQGDSTFVVVAHPPSGKFVQFVGSASSPVMLDLPWQTMSEQEFYRAVKYFKQWGVAGQEYPVLDQPGGMPVGDQFTFQMTFRSMDTAVEVAWGVFQHVYQLPQDCSLTATKGWLT
jgi:hypothetical protein